LIQPALPKQPRFAVTIGSQNGSRLSIRLRENEFVERAAQGRAIQYARYGAVPWCQRLPENGARFGAAAKGGAEILVILLERVGWSNAGLFNRSRNLTYSVIELRVRANSTQSIENFRLRNLCFVCDEGRASVGRHSEKSAQSRQPCSRPV